MSTYYGDYTLDLRLNLLDLLANNYSSYYRYGDQFSVDTQFFLLQLDLVFFGYQVEL